VLIGVNLCLEKLKTRISLIHTDLQSHHTNPKRWLPPCCPIGHWWQGQLYNTAHPNSQINRKAPATPLTTRAGEADQNGHQARVKARGAAEEPKKGWGLALLNNLKNIYQVAPALTDITSNYTLPTD